MRSADRGASAALPVARSHLVPRQARSPVEVHQVESTTRLRHERLPASGGTVIDGPGSVQVQTNSWILWQSNQVRFVSHGPALWTDPPTARVLPTLAAQLRKGNWPTEGIMLQPLRRPFGLPVRSICGGRPTGAPTRLDGDVPLETKRPCGSAAEDPTLSGCAVSYGTRTAVVLQVLYL